MIGANLRPAKDSTKNASGAIARLLYELVAARQIIKNAKLELLPAVIPVVIITHEEEFDSAPMMEVSVRRNEYVTRLSDYDQLAYLLEYLLPIRPKAEWNGPVDEN